MSITLQELRPALPEGHDPCADTFVHRGPMGQRRNECPRVG